MSTPSSNQKNPFFHRLHYWKCFMAFLGRRVRERLRHRKSSPKPKKNPYNDDPCEQIELNVPHEKIHQEILKIQKYLVSHREESGMGWSSFCIHGKSYDATKEDAYYKDPRPHNWTKEAIEHMPHTISWLKTLGYSQFQRVRVMCLAPKGFINIHRDQTESKFKAVNVAITNPSQCKFYLEHHGELKFQPGVAYRLNLVNYLFSINHY